MDGWNIHDTSMEHEASENERLQNQLNSMTDTLNRTQAEKRRWRRIGSGCLAVILLGIVLVWLVGRANRLEQENEQLREEYDQLAADAAEKTIEVTNEIVVTDRALRELIAPASDLTTYKYYYTDVGEYEKDKKIGNITVPFTTDRAIFSYSGVIGVGIRLDDVGFSIDRDKKEVAVLLPPIRVLSHTLSEEDFRYYDQKNSVFTSSDLGEYSELIAALKTEQEDKMMRKSDFLDGARSSTETVLASFFRDSALMADYALSFRWEAE